MIPKEMLKHVIVESLAKFPVSLTRRLQPDAEKYLNIKEVLVITGARRSGKTFFMYQLINQLLSKLPKQNILYINFEDERLAFIGREDLNAIYEAFLELNNPEGKLYFFFDEIQNVPLWEKWISRMYEKDIKFVISGSNASLLSSEFSAALTGRNIGTSIFPFSFREFLSVREPELLSLQPNEILYVSENRAKIKRLFTEYINAGGFPEVVLENKKEILPQYFKDILYRDIIARKNIKFKESIEKLALYLIANTSSLTSFYRLKKIIEARSINTIKNYVSFLEEAFLIFRVPLFSYSLKQQIYNPFKVYCVDTGLRNAVSFRFMEDFGKLAENLVFLQLKRMGKEVYYWKDKGEVDFVIKEGLKPKHLIQVCWNVSDSKARSREVSALVKCAEKFSLNEGIVLTEDYAAEERLDDIRIKFVPMWCWMLEILESHE